MDIRPDSYGSRGQKWHRNFVEYMVEMVSSETYKGMPDMIKDDGKIQWEAPSNRASGQYQFTNRKRKEWWRLKAKEIGISVDSDKWISKTAKAIHPTLSKPCKRCGRILRLQYVYPQRRLIRKFYKNFGNQISIGLLDEISDVVSAYVENFGKNSISKIEQILSTNQYKFSRHDNVDSLLDEINTKFIPSEPSILSPGAMSNAPDRLDGFHSFNLCCRKSADRGRSTSNLASYANDRRVFEYWSDGNWVAANTLMGIIRSRFSMFKNEDGKVGATADHIGPLSLGFSHKPFFKLLSKSANSAKNNRLDLNDVEKLKELELKETVVSWHSKQIWESIHPLIKTDRDARKASRILRDHHRFVIQLLFSFYKNGHLTFLIHLMDLKYCNFDYSFPDLKIVDYFTVTGRINTTERINSHSTSQKKRRIRVGLNSLVEYKEKENRHSFTMDKEKYIANINQHISNIKNAYQYKEIISSDVKINNLLENNLVDDFNAGKILSVYNNVDPTVIKFHSDEIKNYISNQLLSVAEHLKSMWNNPRFDKNIF